MTTGLPPEVQLEMIRHIEGLQTARILQYGYAIEYDYTPPTQLKATLETKGIPALFMAGQVNGTTGYEEAAGQGLMAGLNAARRVAGEDGLVLRRDQAYIGVMIDDLVTKGVVEPYRMFTSRAEYRLQLRADNADVRLTPPAESLGLIGADRTRRFARLNEGVTEARRLVESIRLDGKTLAQHLANPNVRISDLTAPDGAATEPLKAMLAANAPAVELVATDCLYAGYVARQRQQADQLGRLDAQKIPEWIDYDAVPHLRYEARQRLSEIKPLSLGQALRISGITPADISVLAVHCHAGRPATDPPEC